MFTVGAVVCAELGRILRTIWYLAAIALTLDSDDAGGGTLLRLEHAGFTVENDSTYSILKRGWSGDKMRASITRVTESL